MPAAALPDLLAAVRGADDDDDRLAACWEVWCHCETSVAAMARREDRLTPAGVSVEEFREAVTDRARERLVVAGGFARVEADDAFWGFVRTTVRHEAISEYRHRVRRPRAVSEPPAPAEDEGDEPSYRLEPGTPESDLRAAQRTGILRRVADEVAAGSRNGWRWVRAIRLRFSKGLTFQQIATEMNVNERTAQRYVERGLGAFRHGLEQRGIALADLLNNDAPE